MRRRRLLWQLYPPYLLITVAALLALSWYATRTLREVHLQEVANDLQGKAQLVAESLETIRAIGQPEAVAAQTRQLAERAGARITVVQPNGTVVGDSEEDPARMMNHADRPELREALAGRVGTMARSSPTLGHEMMYVAVPLREGGRIVGAVRASVPLTPINRLVRSISSRFYVSAVVAGLVVALASLAVSRRISRSLYELTQGARSFARGELQHRLPLPETEELRLLATAMNHMAVELDSRLQTLVSQRNQLEALLGSMQDGVLAVDGQEHVIILNAAAARMVGADPQQGLGRSIQEVVRNSDLQKFVAEVLAGEGLAEAEVVVEGPSEQYMDAHGAVLRDAQGLKIGAVVVLHDITEFKRLAAIRRDFVANVSHELKTPITLIKGFVETLLDGNPHSPEDVDRFLGIIAKQANRMYAIIEDLLSLSRVEQEDGGRIARENVCLRGVLEAALKDCEPKAGAKKIRLILDCDEKIRADLNGPLMEQVIINLVDNAIQYSEAGQTVQVGAAVSGAEVTLYVRDHGSGIPREHLPRVFERFYRVDKGRSRALGGTGLGLAIVKHIVQAHGGRISVQSTVGEGSTFHIHVPVHLSDDSSEGESRGSVQG
jgi:two-component system phosphate regulon sensor histidine kinase PhoR